jgi:hypothetical protein
MNYGGKTYRLNSVVLFTYNVLIDNNCQMVPSFLTEGIYRRTKFVFLVWFIDRDAWNIGHFVLNIY